MIDRQAFERFYRETVPGLEKLVVRLAGSRSEAEEVVQEAYYRFLRSGFAAPAEEERRRYLYRIALNLMKSRWAREKRERGSITEEPSGPPTRSLSGTDGSGTDGPGRPPTRSLSGVEGSVDSAESQAAASTAIDVQATLRRMRPRDRALLWLAYVEGCTHREVGEMMRIGAASVRVLLFRARQRFIALMQRGR